MPIQRAAILGAAGAIGHSAGAELLRREIPFRAIRRDGKKLDGAFAGQAEIRTADINDSDQTARALARLRHGRLRSRLAVSRA